MTTTYAFGSEQGQTLTAVAAWSKRDHQANMSGALEGNINPQR